MLSSIESLWKSVRGARNIELVREPPRYSAFISYAHEDENEASRLHKALESYVLPTAIRLSEGGRRRPFHPVYRDHEELIAGLGLTQRLKSALEASDNLIVLLSPHSAASEWVDLEVESFIALGRADRILGIMIAGDPEAPPGDPNCCLPPSLRALAGDGDSLWVDWRGTDKTDRHGFLTLVAALLQLRSLDELIRRDAGARFWRRIGLAAAATLGAGLLAGIVVSAIEAERSRSAIFLDAARASFADGAPALASQFALLSLPPPDGALFDFSPDAARLLAADILYRDDVLSSSNIEEIVAISDDGTLALSRSTMHADVWDLRANRLLMSLPWRGLPNARSEFTRDGLIVAEAAPQNSVIGTHIVDPIQRTDSIIHGLLDPDADAVLRGPPVAVDIDLTIERNGDYAGIAIVDSGTRQVIRRFTTNRGSNSRSLSADGRFLLMAEYDGVSVWDTVSGRAVVDRTFGLQNQSWFLGALSPDGSRALLYLRDNYEVWALNREEAALVATIPTSASPSRLEQPFSQDGRLLAVQTDAQQIELWDAHTGQRLASWTQTGSPIQSVTLSPDGNRLAAANFEGTITQWSLGEVRIASANQRTRGEVTWMRYAPDGRSLLTLTNGLFTAFDGTGRRGGELVTTQGPRISALAFNGAEDGLWSAGVDGLVRLYSLADHAPQRLFRSDLREVSDVEVLAADRWLLLSSFEQGLRLHDAVTGRQALGLEGGRFEGSTVTAIAVSASGDRAVVGTSTGRAKLVDLGTGEVVAALAELPSAIAAISLSPDGRLAEVHSVTGDLRVVEVASGRVRINANQVFDAAFSPDSRTLATIGTARGLEILDARSGRLIVSASDGRDTMEGFVHDGLRFVDHGRILIDPADQAWLTEDLSRLPAAQSLELNLANMQFRFVVSRRSNATLADLLIDHEDTTYRPVAISRSGTRLAVAYPNGIILHWPTPRLASGREIASDACAARSGAVIDIPEESLTDPSVVRALRRGDRDPCRRAGLLHWRYWIGLQWLNWRPSPQGLT